jgi:hypothetical protein
LEEIVGLDTSYHGGVILGDSDCQPEYISAFNRRREEKKRRFSSSSFKAHASDHPMEDTDPDGDERDAEDDP